VSSPRKTHRKKGGALCNNEKPSQKRSQFQRQTDSPPQTHKKNKKKVFPKKTVLLSEKHLQNKKKFLFSTKLIFVPMKPFLTFYKTP